MLLSSNVIHICVSVVMLVRMICTRLFAAAWVKSCPGMHSSYVLASSFGCACTVGLPPGLGGGPGIDKRKLLMWSPLKVRTRSPLKARACNPLKSRMCRPMKPSEGEGVSPLKVRACSPLKVRACSPLKARTCSPLEARACSPMKARVCSPLKTRTCSPLKVRTCSPLKARTCSPLKGRTYSPLKARMCSPLKAWMCSPLKVRMCSPLKVRRLAWNRRARKKMNLQVRRRGIHGVAHDRKENVLRRPYRICARARVMGEVEEVLEQMKADTEALKEQMATMIEAMMSIKEIMEVSAATIAATSTIAGIFNHSSTFFVRSSSFFGLQPGGPLGTTTLTFRGLHALAFRGLHALAFRGLHALAFRGLHVLAFRGLHALTFRGLHVLTFRGLHILAIRGLHALAFRELHVLAFRGLHALAFRGLHALTFRGLHVLAFRGLHTLAFKGLLTLPFRGLHVLAIRGLHVLTFRGLQALAFRGLHILTFRGLHTLVFRGLLVLAFSGLHALTFRGLHNLTFRGLHVLAIRGLYALAIRGLHAPTFRGLHVLTFRWLHTPTFRGLHWATCPDEGKDPLEGLGGPMTRARARKAKEALQQVLSILFEYKPKFQGEKSKPPLNLRFTIPFINYMPRTTLLRPTKLTTLFSILSLIYFRIFHQGLILDDPKSALVPMRSVTRPRLQRAARPHLRGLHALAFRGLHALAFKGRQVLDFRGLHALAFKGLCVLTFSGLHIRTLREFKLLCIPWQDFTRAAAKRRVRIMRTNMTTLTQIWMTLLLSNILPSDHNVDIPLRKYQLGSRPQDTQWTQRSPIGPCGFQLWLWAFVSPTGCPSPLARSCHRDIGKHPVDPEKSNRVLGFPALITGLCQFYGVPVAPSKVIKPRTNQALIKKYYAPKKAQGETPQQPGHGRQWTTDALPPSPDSSTKRLECCLRHMADQQATKSKAKVSKSIRSVTDKSSRDQLKMLKKCY
ncbi:Dynein heavy chain [Glycine soja]